MNAPYTLDPLKRPELIRRVTNIVVECIHAHGGNLGDPLAMCEVCERYLDVVLEEEITIRQKAQRIATDSWGVLVDKLFSFALIAVLLWLIWKWWP